MIWQLQEVQWITGRYSGRQAFKSLDKTLEAYTGAVKEYLRSCVIHRVNAKIAIDLMETGKVFSPESLNIIKKRHDELRELMDELESMIEKVPR